MYTPGYWVNRIPPFFPPCRTFQFWLLTLLDVVILGPSFLITLYVHFFVEPFKNGGLLLGYLGLAALLSGIRAYTLRPNFAAMRELRRLRKETDYREKQKEKKRKRQPKHRKDYK